MNKNGLYAIFGKILYFLGQPNFWLPTLKLFLRIMRLAGKTAKILNASTHKDDKGCIASSKSDRRMQKDTERTAQLSIEKVTKRPVPTGAGKSCSNESFLREHDRRK